MRLFYSQLDGPKSVLNVTVFHSQLQISFVSSVGTGEISGDLALDLF